MSAKAAERGRPLSRPRRNSVWRELFADPVRKLIAMALATLLWLFLDRQITERQYSQFKLIGERASKDAEESEIRDSHIVVSPPPGYRVTGFRDHMTNAEVTLIEVLFEAPKHQLHNALASPGLFVQPRQVEINQQTNVFVFDQVELRANDPTVIKALRDMKPRRIDVLLERVDEKAMVLDKRVLRVVYPDAKVFPDFPERLRLDAAVFAPQLVTLRGPRSLILDVARNEPLFTLDLSQAGGTTEPKLTVQLTPIAIERLTLDGLPVTITVPLDAQFEPCELTVPVLVDVASRATPQAVDFDYDPTLKVSMHVSGELAGILSRMSPADLSAWAKANARVDVRLDDDWNNQPQVLIGSLRLIDTHYERGRHYRSDGPLSVQIRRKGKRE